MKATAKSNELGRALKLCVNAIDPKDPIRSNIECVAEGDNIHLKATCSQLSVSVICNAKVDDEGVAIVDGKTAYNVIAKASGDCVLSSDSKSMTIKTSGRTKLPNINNPLPMIQQTDGNKVTCDAVAFKNAVNKIFYAIGEDQSHLILTGAHIVSDGQTLVMTSLDGFRLAQTEIICEGDNIDMVVPSRVLEMICNCIIGDTLTIVSNGIHLTVVGDGFILNAITLSVNYIDTERIVPTTFRTKVLINSSAIKNVMDSATVASGSTNLVKLEIGDEKIIVTSNSEDADFHGDVDALVDGNPLTIAFNLKYLIQAFNHIETEQSVINMSTPVSPAVITDKNEGVKSDIHLILPVRTFS